ncbi:MAG: HAMP domain-containing protein, partial [Pseudomonadota bacterium]
MVIGFLSVAVVMLIGAALSLVGVHRILESFEGGEEHFRSIVANAVQVADEAKGAEQHLMIYLLIGRREERERFEQIQTAVANASSTLDLTIRDPGARRIYAMIREDVLRIAATAKEILAAYDAFTAENRVFKISEHADAVTRFTDATAAVREHSIRLAQYETNFLNRQESITAATDVCNYARRLEGHLIRYLALGDQADRKKVDDRSASLRHTLDVLNERVEHPAGRELLSRIKQDTELLTASAGTLLGIYDSDVHPSGSFRPTQHHGAIREIHQRVHWIVDNGKALAKLNVELETQVKARAQASARVMHQGLVVTLMAAVVLALVLAYVVSNRLSEPIRKLEAAAHQIAGGNLDARAEVSSQDEIGTLADAFNGMAESLARSQRRLIENGQELERRSDELKRVNERLEKELALRKTAETEVAAGKARVEFLLGASPVVLYTCTSTGDK